MEVALARDTLPPVQPFSWLWVGISMVVYVVVELLLGGLLAGVMAGRMASPGTEFALRQMLQVGAFLVGGFGVGLVSPRLRLLEPAVGAALAIVVIGILTLFTPLRMYGYSSGGLLLAAALAFGCGLVGAWFGERLAGNL